MWFYFGHGYSRQSGVPAHGAVGLTGGAPRLIPSHGHSALIPDASGPPGLRAPLAGEAVECVGEAALLFPSTYHVVLAVKGCAPCPSVGRLRPCGRLRPLTAALRRVSPVPGNSARFGLEHDHVATFSFPRFFPSRSRCRR